MSPASDHAGATPARRLHIEDARGSSRDDAIVVEEPLELRLDGAPVATLMRTPGDDRALALGFFLTEGIIGSLADVGALAFCARGAAGAGAGAGGAAASGHGENVADLLAAAGSRLCPPPTRMPFIAASCGVCGKRTIEEVLARTPLAAGFDAARSQTASEPQVSASLLTELPHLLRRGQSLFELTGAVHAAGLFDARGHCLRVAEDVGRHNAVDKVVGWALHEGKVPLGGHLLQVSGRVSFEIVQKAYAAGIPLVAAVSGVSSLARDLAERAGMTLVGFVRGASFSVYTHPQRVRMGAP